MNMTNFLLTNNELFTDNQETIDSSGMIEKLTNKIETNDTERRG